MLQNASLHCRSTLVLTMCTADTDTVCKLILPPDCSKHAFCCADDTIPGIIWAAPTVGTQLALANTSAILIRYRDSAGKPLHLVDIGLQHSAHRMQTSAGQSYAGMSLMLWRSTFHHCRLGLCCLLVLATTAVGKWHGRKNGKL